MNELYEPEWVGYDSYKDIMEVHGHVNVCFVSVQYWTEAMSSVKLRKQSAQDNKWTTIMLSWLKNNEGASGWAFWFHKGQLAVMIDFIDICSATSNTQST